MKMCIMTLFVSMAFVGCVTPSEHSDNSNNSENQNNVITFLVLRCDPESGTFYSNGSELKGYPLNFQRTRGAIKKCVRSIVECKWPSGIKAEIDISPYYNEEQSSVIVRHPFLETGESKLAYDYDSTMASSSFRIISYNSEPAGANIYANGNLMLNKYYPKWQVSFADYTNGAIFCSYKVVWPSGAQIDEDIVYVFRDVSGEKEIFERLNYVKGHFKCRFVDVNNLKANVTFFRPEDSPNKEIDIFNSIEFEKDRQLHKDMEYK